MVHIKFIWFYNNEHLGQIGIASDETAITNLYFNSCKTEAITEETPLIHKAYEQLKEYLNNKRTAFNLPFTIEGTPFQQAVWKELANIPYGETRSYKQIALALGNEKACRAVGMANNKNPLPIFIPCHRVIGADGDLTGYAGGLLIKKILLCLEARPSASTIDKSQAERLLNK